MATIEDVRALGSELERSYPVYVRGILKFRVKQIVYVAFSRDQKLSRAYDLGHPAGPG